MGEIFIAYVFAYTHTHTHGDKHAYTDTYEYTIFEREEYDSNGKKT